MSSSAPSEQRGSTASRQLVPKDDLSRSVIGFVAALIAGALVPRAVGYLVKRLLVRSFKEVFILAFAGWLADFLVSLVSGSADEQQSA